MNKSNHKTSKGSIVSLLIGTIIFVSIFEIAPLVFSIPIYIFPPAHMIISRIWTDGNYLFGNSIVTFFEAMCGLVLASIVAILIGITTSDRKVGSEIGLKAASILQTIPIVAIAPIVILWSGPGFASKVLMAMLIGCPPLIVAAIEGFRSTPIDLLNVLTVMGCPKRAIFWAVRLPYAFRQITLGLRISAALTTIGAIVAEYAGSTSGIGYVIMQASYRSDAILLFAAVALAIAIGLILVGIARLSDSLINRSLTGR